MHKQQTNLEVYTKMKFEKKFPELNNIYQSPMGKKCIIEPKEGIFNQSDIERHCLSKQRVKKIIEDICHKVSYPKLACVCGAVIKNDLLKELELEE